MNIKLIINVVFLMVIAGIYTNIVCVSVAHKNIRSIVANSRCMNSEEKAYIYRLTNDIEEIFGFFRERIMKFVDKMDKTPYREYVLSITRRMDEFEKTTMVELRNNIILSRDSDCAVFHEGISIVEEVLNEFLKRVKGLRAILEDYMNVRNDIRKAIELGKRVKPILTDLVSKETIKRLAEKIDLLCELLEEANEDELFDRMLSIQKVINNLSSGSGVTLSDAAVLTCITTKLRHN